MKKTIKILFVMILVPLILLAGEVKPDNEAEIELKSMIEKAEKIMKDKDKKDGSLDYYLARAMGIITMNEEKLGKSWKKVDELIIGRKLLSTAMVPSTKFSKSFISFYFSASASMWGCQSEGTSEKTHQCMIMNTSTEDYHAEVIAIPQFEKWFMQDDKKGINADLPLTSNENAPILIVAKIKNNKLEKKYEEINLESGTNSLQFIWPAEFSDLDNDKVPEVFIRCNKVGALGFTQCLYIYKITGEKLKLMKKFEGASEGIARRMNNNTFEVGYGWTDKNEAHFSLEETRIETWEYKNGEFKKVSEKKIPHILWSDEWIKYYFPK